MYSHNGFWKIGSFSGDFFGQKDTAIQCAENCLKYSTCVGIYYIESGSEMKKCYLYFNAVYLKHAYKKAKVHTKAYIRCKGNFGSF